MKLEHLGVCLGLHCEEQFDLHRALHSALQRSALVPSQGCRSQQLLPAPDTFLGFFKELTTEM